MTFELSKDELAKLSSFVKATQTISDASIKAEHYVINLDDKNLTAVIYGNGNTIKFGVAITNFVKADNESSMFNANINMLIQSFEKVYASAGVDIATADVVGNKITVSSGKSKISMTTLDNMSVEDCNEALTDIDNRKKAYFTSKAPRFANLTKEVIDFTNVVGKFITMIGSDNVSGIGLQGNRILYSDQTFSIVDKVCSSDVTRTNTDGTIDKCFIPQSMFAFFNEMSKFDSNLMITYSDNDDQYVNLSIPDINFEAIMSMPTIVCEYPDEETLKNIKPTEKNSYQFDVDIPTFLNKVGMFEGVFPASQWRWKRIDVTVDPKGVRMSYFNFNAEVDTDLPVDNFVSTSATDTYTFSMASLIIYDYLNKLAGDEKTVHITVSPLDTSAENGMGIQFDLNGMKITSCKLLPADTF